jgi:hypothetical protein
MQAIRAGLKIRRRVNVTDTELAQIRHDLARLREREPPVELQPVSASRNAWVLGLHSFSMIREENVQRSTSNVQC